MATDEEDHVVEDVVSAVRDALGKHGIMASRVVVLAETLEPNGDVAMWTAVDKGTKPWHSNGLLVTALMREQAGMLDEEE